MDNLQTSELEAIVLGCLLVGANFEDVSEHVSEGDFFNPEHRRIFKAIRQQFDNDNPIDPVALIDQGLNIDVISKAHTYQASPTHANHYAKKLAIHSLIRTIRESLVAANSQLSPDNHLEIISELVRTLDSATISQIKTAHDWNDVIAEGIAEIDALNQRNKQLIHTGLPSLDRKFAPIHGSRLIIIAARPGTGKTALAQQIALTTAKQNKSTGIISLEMATHELAIRSFANQFNINCTSLSRGDTDSLHSVINNPEYESFGSYEIFVDDASYKLETITARISQWKRQVNIDLAIIDHIGLIEISKDNNRNEALGIISRTLKKLSKQLDIPIIALCQLNRSMEKEDRDPRLSDLRESGHIEQDADMVIILKEINNSDDFIEAPGNRLIETHIVKNRIGPIGKLNPFIFKGQTQRFVEE